MTDILEKHLSENNINEFLDECTKSESLYLGLLISTIYIDEEPNNNQYKIFQNTFKNNINKKSQIEKQNSIRETPDIKHKTVKLLCNWTTSEDLACLWNKMSKGNYCWDNIKLVWGEIEPDYYIVINKPPISESIIEPSKTIILHMEPNIKENRKLWGKWSDPDPSIFVKVCSHDKTYNNNEWHISLTYNQLLTYKPEKKYDNIISTILSEKYENVGHIKRIDFVKFLETKDDIKVDVYGSNKWNYKNYKGFLPYHEKDNGLFPYKYTFNVENHSIKNYFTEKVIDAILSETLIFYSGCYNLKEYIDENAFVYLELIDFEHDYNVIKHAIDNNLWAERLPFIKIAKQKILTELQFFPRIKKIIENFENQNKLQ